MRDRRDKAHRQRCKEEGRARSPEGLLVEKGWKVGEMTTVELSNLAVLRVAE